MNGEVVLLSFVLGREVALRAADSETWLQAIEAPRAAKPQKPPSASRQTQIPTSNNRLRRIVAMKNNQNTKTILVSRSASMQGSLSGVQRPDGCFP